MSIDQLRVHYSFGRMPFSKDLAPGILHHHRAHAEAVARISWCISERAIGVITGECGSGKTVAARAAMAACDASRHTVVYLGTPGAGTRGTYAAIVAALGGIPRFHAAALIPQTQNALAVETQERGKTVTVIIDEAPHGRRRDPRRPALPGQCRHRCGPSLLSAPARPANPAPPPAARGLHGPGAAGGLALCPDRA
ncbi:MAG TPA: AAA family ATPase [Candidatus Acidoferrales bacterium]|nr:AAA family ATPase [Candidatus Acidoferrales bacterium]